MADDQIDTTTFDLDLDALSDKPVKIKLNGKAIDIFPPDVQSIFELTSFMNRFKTVDRSNPEGMISFVDDFKKAFAQFIPGIENERLSIKQLFALVEYISTIAIPKNTDRVEFLGDSGKKSPDQQD